MNGLFGLCGTGATIELGGDIITVQGRTLRHWAEMEGHYLCKRGNAFDWARRLLPQIEDEAVAAGIGSEIVRDMRFEYSRVSQQELATFRDSWEGRLFALWQAVRHNGYRYADASAAFSDDCSSYVEMEHRWYEIRYAIDLASGESELSSLEMIHDIDIGGGGKMQWEMVVGRMCNDPFDHDVNHVLDMTIPQLRVVLAKMDDLKYDGRESEQQCTLPSHIARFNMNYDHAGRNLAQGIRWDVMSDEERARRSKKAEPHIAPPSKRMRDLHRQMQKGVVSEMGRALGQDEGMAKSTSHDQKLQELAAANKR